MLRQLYRDFIDNVPSVLPELLNVVCMKEPQTYDDQIFLVFNIDGEYTLDEVVDMLDENKETVTLYYHIPSDQTIYGHSVCVYSKPNLGRLYKMTARTDGDGRVHCLCVTLYAYSEAMLADLRIELEQHSDVGRFKEHISKEQLLRDFMWNV